MQRLASEQHNLVYIPCIVSRVLPWIGVVVLSFLSLALTFSSVPAIPLIVFFASLYHDLQNHQHEFETLFCIQSSFQVCAFGLGNSEQRLVIDSLDDGGSVAFYCDPHD